MKTFKFEHPIIDTITVIGLILITIGFVDWFVDLLAQ